MKIAYLKNISFYIYIFFSVILISLINLILVPSIIDNAKMYNYYNSIKYDYTLLAENRKQNSYYFLDDDNYSLILSQDNSLLGYINAVCLMQVDDKYSELGYYNESNILIGVYKRLNYNECSITENVASKYGLKVGNIIFNLYNEKITEYKIVNILKNTYNFLTPKEGVYQAYIFSGYNENKVSKEKYLSFSIFNDEIDKNATNYCFTSTIIKKCKSNLTLEYCLTLIFYLIMIIIYYVLNQKDIINMLRLYNLGYKKKKLIKYLLIETIFTITIMFIFGLIFEIFINKILIYMIEIIILCLFIYVVNVFKIFWRLKDGKRNFKIKQI